MITTKIVAERTPRQELENAQDHYNVAQWRYESHQEVLDSLESEAVYSIHRDHHDDGDGLFYASETIEVNRTAKCVYVKRCPPSRPIRLQRELIDAGRVASNGRQEFLIGREVRPLFEDAQRRRREITDRCQKRLTECEAVMADPTHPNHRIKQNSLRSIEVVA